MTGQYPSLTRQNRHAGLGFCHRGYQQIGVSPATEKLLVMLPGAGDIAGFVFQTSELIERKRGVHWGARHERVPALVNWFQNLPISGDGSSAVTGSLSDPGSRFELRRTVAVFRCERGCLLERHLRSLQIVLGELDLSVKKVLEELAQGRLAFAVKMLQARERLFRVGTLARIEEEAAKVEGPGETSGFGAISATSTRSSRLVLWVARARSSPQLVSVRWGASTAMPLK